MRFDRTGGKKARYMVSIYRGMVNDQIYYHYYKQAKACFEGIKNGERIRDLRAMVIMPVDAIL